MPDEIPIPVAEETRKRLHRLKRPDETVDDVLQELLDAGRTDE